MSDESTDYRPYAGQVAFPRSPADLTSTATCPACLSPVKNRAVCPVCGLNLRGTDAVELASVSAQTAALLDQRLNLIGRIRYTTAAALAPRPAAAAASAAAPAATVAAPAPPVQSPVASVPSVERPARRFSSVQVILLIVGISLLSIAAIFFLIYAFITFGLNVRSIIVGSITLASIVVATILRRRRLPATAEGIAAFAIVLVYLDTWAIPANDFFGSASVNRAEYWGFALLVAGVLLYLWTRLTGLRLPSVVGFAAVAPGVGLLLGWALRDQPDAAVTTFAAFAATGVVGLVARFGRLAERIVSRVVTALALVAAILTAFFFDQEGSNWATTIGLLIVAAIAAAHVVFAPRNPTGVDTAFVAIIAALGAGSLAATIGAAAARVDDPGFSAVAPPLAAVAVTLALEFAWRARRGAVLLTAAIASAAVAACTLVLPTITLLAAAVRAVATGLGWAWTIDANDKLIYPTPVLGASAVGLVAVILLAVLAWLAERVILQRGRVLTWAITITALLVMPTLSITWFVLLGWLVIGALALVALLRFAHELPDHARPALVTALIAALTLAYLSSWAALDTWAATSLLVVAGLLLARAVFRGHAGIRTGFLAPALVVVMVAAGAGARDLALPLHSVGDADTVNVLRAVGFAAILLLGSNGILRLRSISIIDRRVGFWLTAPVILVATIWAQFRLAYHPGGVYFSPLLLPEYLTSIAVSIFLIAALLVWSLSKELTGLRAERMVSVLALPFALFWLMDVGSRQLLLGNVAFPMVVALCLLHIAALTVPGLAALRPAGWSAIGLAALVGIVGFATDDLTRVEFASVPIGVALIVSGIVHLVTHPAARSWAWLAPGVGILLVPSLIATAVDAPLWRIVGLGVVAVAVLVASVLLRLQAPFLISVVVLLIHAIATFSPELRFVYEAVAWWVWLAIGGVIIVVLSVRFEKSRLGIKKAISSVAALR